LAGEYGQSDRINEKAHAEQFGVSRASIREACRILEKSGLVTIVPNYGAFIKQLDLEEIIHIFDIRAALARLAGYEAASAITKPAVDELCNIMDALDVAVQEQKPDKYIELNMAFHHLLYSTTGNARLIHLESTMGKELQMYRRHGLAYGGGLNVSNEEHRGILEAIQHGRRHDAASLLEEHVRNGKDRFLRAVRATGHLIFKP